MSRAGRKRLAAQRKSGIRVVAGPIEIVRSPNEVARSQPHRRYEDDCHDARAASSLGYLNLIGAIPNSEYQTAERFAGIVRRWREVMDCPRPAQSIAGIGLPVPAGVEIEDAAQRKADYENAMRALGKASNQARAITLHVVVDGGRVPARGFGRLMEGLRALR
jgi:hypothetical protein